MADIRFSPISTASLPHTIPGLDAPVLSAIAWDTLAVVKMPWIQGISVSNDTCRNTQTNILYLFNVNECVGNIRQQQTCMSPWAIALAVDSKCEVMSSCVRHPSATITSTRLDAASNFAVTGTSKGLGTYVENMLDGNTPFVRSDSLTPYIQVERSFDTL